MATDLPRGFRFELRHWLFAGSWNWSYFCEGRLGAVEFHVSESTRSPDREIEYYGGIEIHRAVSNADDGPPSHGRCRALSDRACWHDGSSLYASESWIPMWKHRRDDHISIFRRLAVEYRERFEAEREDSDA